MDTKHSNSKLDRAVIETLVSARGAGRQDSLRTRFVVTGAVAVLLLSGCVSSPRSVSPNDDERTSNAATATATPPAITISKTPCGSAGSEETSAGATYICTVNESGQQIWLERSESKDLTAKIAAAAAAEKAAADKAAADAATADAAAKVAADAKAAEEAAAADKAAADAAAAEAAAKAAADAKAAEEAAAAQAAAAAEAAKAAPAPAPAPAPPAPKYVAPAAPAAPSGCDPNYSGCVPIASDVDCAGGSGNGPAYVQGPVRVLGSDIYGLDRDSDGIGCEG